MPIHHWFHKFLAVHVLAVPFSLTPSKESVYESDRIHGQVLFPAGHQGVDAPGWLTISGFFIQSVHYESWPRSPKVSANGISYQPIKVPSHSYLVHSVAGHGMGLKKSYTARVSRQSTSSSFSPRLSVGEHRRIWWVVSTVLILERQFLSVICFTDA